MNFGDGVGASLVRGPYCQLDVGLCGCWCVSTLEQRSGRRCRGGLKTGPSRRHRIQPTEGPFLGPRAKETCLKKGSESGPAWNQKWSPLEGPLLVPFWPFIVANLLKRLFQVEIDLTSNSCGWNLELGRPIFARLLFLTFWGPKTGPFFVLLFCSNFHSLEASRLALRPSLCASCGLKF